MSRVAALVFCAATILGASVVPASATLFDEFEPSRVVRGDGQPYPLSGWANNFSNGHDWEALNNPLGHLFVRACVGNVTCPSAPGGCCAEGSTCCGSSSVITRGKRQTSGECLLATFPGVVRTTFAL